MKRLGLLLFAILFALVLAACGGDSDDNFRDSDSSDNQSSQDNGSSDDSSDSGDVEVIKIGTLHPLTGPQASEGQEMRDAIQLAIDEINENGGIKSLGGAKVELVASDSENNPEKGISEVQTMDSAGVVGIIGPYTTAVALAATQEAERIGVPFIVDVGSADAITERGFKYTFRIQPNASKFPEAFLKYVPMLNEENGVELTTVINAHEDSDFGTGMANVLKENAATAGIDVIDTLPHSYDTADLSTDVNKIKAQNPDIVSATTYLNDGQLLVETLIGADVKPKAIIGMASGAFSNAKFIREQTSINQYIMDINYAMNPNSELTAEIKAKYEEKYNKGLGPNAAISYTAAIVLLDAIERAGSTDRDAIRDAIAETKLSDHILAQDEIVFDETGQNANAQPVVNQIIDGQSYVVMPEPYKERDAVYPLPN